MRSADRGELKISINACNGLVYVGVFWSDAACEVSLWLVKVSKTILSARDLSFGQYCIKECIKAKMDLGVLWPNLSTELIHTPKDGGNYP